MGVCFICNRKLHLGCVRVCSSITPHSMIPYPEKIAELLGDEFVVIITPADHMCNNCSTLLTHMDKLENDLKIVKNEVLSIIHKKYKLLLPHQTVKGVEIVNGHSKAEEKLEQGQSEVCSGPTLEVSPTVTTNVHPVQTSSKLLKTQQQQQQQQPKQQKCNSTNNIYKCSLCTYQSKKLEHTRFHMCHAHMNRKEPEKPILVQAMAIASTLIINEHSKAEKQLEQCQHEVVSDVTLGVSPAVSPPVDVNSVQISFKSLKTQQQPPAHQNYTNTIYKCCLCEFFSKEFRQVQYHMSNCHTEEEECEKHILEQEMAIASTSIINEHSKAEKQLEQCQNEVFSDVTLRVSPAVSSPVDANSVQTSFNLLKTQQPPAHQKYTNSIYKCCFCELIFKDLRQVQFHLSKCHTEVKEPEEPILEQATAMELTPLPQLKRRVYRCQVCSKSFDIRADCLNHIQKNHKLMPSTSNIEKENDGSCQITSKFVNLEPFKAQGKNQQADASMDVDENQQDNKDTVDTDMMLIDNVRTEGFIDAEQEEIENSDEEVSKNSQEDKTPKVFKSIKKTKPAQEDATEEEEQDKEGAAEEEEVENTAVPEQEEADQDSVEKEVEEDCANVENKPGDLDIESMLAAIHNNNAPTNNSVDTQNKA